MVYCFCNMKPEMHFIECKIDLELVEVNKKLLIVFIWHLEE